MPAFSPLASLPRRGSLVVRALSFRSDFRLSAFIRREDGKCSVSLGICSAFSSVVSLGWRVSEVSTESCRVALSSIRGDGVSGIVVQSSLRISRHLGAMGRSQIGEVLMLRFSFSQRAGSVEAKSPRKYVRAAKDVCGRGVRRVGMTHCNSLSSRK
jgi:hypothetical protein